MVATIVDTLPVDLPTNQGASLSVDRSGRLHTGDQPFAGGQQLTPRDDADVSAPHRALWIGVAGDLAGEMLGNDGARKTFATSVQCGVFPFAVLRITVAGTTATGILAGW